MRVLITEPKMTRFMQCADVFPKNKVVCQDVWYDDSEDASEADSLRQLREVCNPLILVCGKERPLYINPDVQVISNGNASARLIDVVRQLYPKLSFTHSKYFTEIQAADQPTPKEQP